MTSFLRSLVEPNTPKSALLRTRIEEPLGTSILDSFQWFETFSTASLVSCIMAFGIASARRFVRNISFRVSRYLLGR